MIGQELVRVEHRAEEPPQARLVDDREHPPARVVGRVHMAHDGLTLPPIGREPVDARGERRQARHRRRSGGVHGDQREQSDDRARAQRHDAAVTGVQHVVVEPVLLVPQPLVVERRRDQREVLEELRREVLVRGVVLGEARARSRACSRSTWPSTPSRRTARASR